MALEQRVQHQHAAADVVGRRGRGQRRRRCRASAGSSPRCPGRICITPRASALETRSLLKPLSCQAIASASEAGTPLAAAIEPTWPRRDALGRRVGRVGRRSLGGRSDRLVAARCATSWRRRVGAARRRSTVPEIRSGAGSGRWVEAVGGGERAMLDAGACGDRGQRVAGLDDVGTAGARARAHRHGRARPAPCPSSGRRRTVPEIRSAFGSRPLAAASDGRLRPARAAIAAQRVARLHDVGAACSRSWRPWSRSSATAPRSTRRRHVAGLWRDLQGRAGDQLGVGRESVGGGELGRR